MGLCWGMGGGVSGEEGQRRWIGMTGVCGGAGQGAGKGRRGSRVESTLSGKWEGWRRSVLCIVEGGIGLPVSVSSLPLTASCRV